jgi:hypothetical protein
MDLKEIGCNGVNWIIWLRIGSMTGSCENGNELSGIIKGRYYLKLLSDYLKLLSDYLKLLSEC